MTDDDHLFDAREVCLDYGRGRSTFSAVTDVSLTVGPGEVVGIVGESGSGKSSFARCVVGLAEPTSGTMTLRGVPLHKKRAIEQHREVQMVFQDPKSSLNPRMSVFELVNETWKTHPSAAPTGDRTRAVTALLDRVGLSDSLLGRRTSQLSGGQAQRVSIARAIAVKPSLLVCDEAVSALDVTVQTQILALLAELRAELGLSMIFISHDLGVVRQIADRTSVMYLGRVVEEGPTLDLFENPQNEYTQSLLEAALDLDHESI